MKKALWTIQALLALLFLFAGGIKLVTPIEEVIKQMPVALPGRFLQFIGVLAAFVAYGRWRIAPLQQRSMP